MVDKILVRELVSYAKSDKLLEWQRLIPWINNLAQKKAKGVFNKSRAVKALADYLFPDTYGRYIGRGIFAKGLPRVDSATKLAFGQAMLRHLTPRIDRTAKRMKKVGLVKGKVVKEHPHYKGMR